MSTTTPAASAPGSAGEADALVAAALACPAVAGLDAGGPRQVVTFLPGRRVAGVRADETRVHVSVVARAGVSVPVLDEQVRRALAPIAGVRPVDVHVADIQL